MVSFLLAAGLPFFNSFKFGGHAVGNAEQLTLLTLAVYFFMGHGFVKLNPGRGKTAPFSRNFFIFTTLILASLVFSGAIREGSFNQLLYYFELAVLYFLFSELLFHPSTFKSIYYGLFAGFSLSVFIAVMQFLKVPAFNLFKEEDLNVNTAYVSDSDAVDVLRVWGPFGNALTFSFYLSVAGSLLFFFFRYVRKKQFIAWTVFVLTLVGIGLTISRMALFAFLFCVVLVHFFSLRRNKRMLFALGMVVVLAAAFIFMNVLSSQNPILSRLNSAGDDFKGGRLALWEVGYKVWMDNLLFGAGPGNMNLALYKAGWTAGGMDRIVIDNWAGHVESYYLTLLFTFGALPFFFYLRYLVGYLRASFSLMIEGFQNSELAYGIPLFGAYVSLVISNLVNPAMNFEMRLPLLMVIQMAVCNNLYKKYISSTLQGGSEQLLPFRTLTV
jgi:hypothetical protein